MKFTITIDIDDAYIDEHCEQNKQTKEDTLREVTNVCYLGVTCIDGMLDRMLGMPLHSDGWVEIYEEEN